MCESSYRVLQTSIRGCPADSLARLKIFPTAASTAGDIGLSNLSLRTITLSLYSE